MASTTSSPTDSNTSTSDVAARRYADYLRFKHYAAWTFVVASPVLIALPPRKLDLYTVALSSAFVVSANHLYRERYGRGILDGLGRRLEPDIDVSTSNSNTSSSSPAGFGGFLSDLPSAKAQEIQAKLRAARDAKIRAAEAENTGVISEEIEKLKARQQQERSLTERIWMGDETEGWKERRLREERKALEEGKGYGDLILDHIWEVWNWGKTTKKEDSQSASSSADSATNKDPGQK